MDTNEQQENNIQTSVLDKIQADELKMRPKAYFVLKLVTLIVVLMLTLGISIYLFSFILFSLSATGQFSLLRLGSEGFLVFLHLFPWILFLVDIILVFILEWLLRQFRFGYKSPVIALLFALFVVIIFSSALVNRETHIHRDLMRASDNHELPFLGGFYEGIRLSPPHTDGVCRCVITNITPTSVTAIDDNTSTANTLTEVTIVLPPTINPDTLHVGDRIFVVGNLMNGVLYAQGINEFPPADPDNF